MKKYELTNESKNINGVDVYRIKAVIDIPHTRVKAGEIGGFVESESNLSHEGSCWIYEDACVIGDAVVIEHASVAENAFINGSAKIAGAALVVGNVHIFGFAEISGNTYIADNAEIFGSVKIKDNAHIGDNAKVYGWAEISGNSQIYDCAKIYGHAKIINTEVCDTVNIYHDAEVLSSDKIHGNVNIGAKAYITSPNDFVYIQGVGNYYGVTMYKTKDNNIMYTQHTTCGSVENLHYKSDIMNSIVNLVKLQLA